MTNKDNGGPASDRELLEMAAKAAGVVGFMSYMPGEPADLFTISETGKAWSPLTDDGDALRLAVKLSVSIDVNGMFVHADCRHRDDDIGYFEENTARNNGCIMTATRRAIVRAAAAIGAGLAPFPTADEILENWT